MPPKSKRDPWLASEDAVITQNRTTTPVTSWPQLLTLVNGLSDSEGNRTLKAIQLRWDRIRHKPTLEAGLNDVEAELLRQAVEKVKKDKWANVAAEYERLAKEAAEVKEKEEGEKEDGEAEKRPKVGMLMIGKVAAQKFWEMEKKISVGGGTEMKGKIEGEEEKEKVARTLKKRIEKDEVKTGKKDKEEDAEKTPKKRKAKADDSDVSPKKIKKEGQNKKEEFEQKKVNEDKIHGEDEEKVEEKQEIVEEKKKPIEEKEPNIMKEGRIDEDRWKAVKVVKA